jgi:DNA/RNA-binding domain of Phe-tRNA-synthetase-like protein
MIFKISNDVVLAYPDLKIAILTGTGVKISSVNNEIEALKRKIESEIRNKFSLETLIEHPFIAAWRDTYRSFGVKPKKYNPTAEALVRRILHGEPIPTINTLVDSYLIVEAEYLLPIGGYDLDKIEGDIHLRYSPGGEQFVPLGRPEELEVTNSNEIVYSDDKKILTRKWNYKDCEQTKITLSTTRVALFMEIADKRIPIETLEKAIKRLEKLVLTYCGGEITTFIALPSKRLEWKIEI